MSFNWESKEGLAGFRRTAISVAVGTISRRRPSRFPSSALMSTTQFSPDPGSLSRVQGFVVIHHSEQGFVSLHQIVLAKTDLSCLHFPYYQRPIEFLDLSVDQEGILAGMVAHRLLKGV